MTFLDWMSVIICVVVAIFSIKITVDDLWGWETFFLIIGCSIPIITMFMIAAYKNYDTIYQFFVYPGILVALTVVCIIIYVHNLKREKHERELKIKNIESNPIFDAIIKDFNSNENYSVIYVCRDGVAFCSYYSDELMKELREQVFYRSESYKDVESKLSNYSKEWMKKNHGIYSVQSIPYAMKTIYYSTYGYDDLDDIGLLTGLVAGALGLKCHFCQIKFCVTQSSSISGPTGAVTYNGQTTFTGYSETVYKGGSKWLDLRGAIYKDSAIIKTEHEHLKSW